MSDPGFVYILINPSLPGMVKVGKTERDPQDRVKELSAATGVPTAFVLAYQEFFPSCSKAEAFVHATLEDKGFRVSSNREFFSAPLNDVINTVIQAKSMTSQLVSEDLDSLSVDVSSDEFLDELSLTVKEPWSDVLEEADEYYYGLSNQIQDYSEAMRLYKRAARLGASEAYRRLGGMYRDGEGCREDSQKALEYFKLGAATGSHTCYGEMAMLFEDTGHISNADKCWDRYFEPRAFLSAPDGRGSIALKYYKSCLSRRVNVRHEECLSAVKHEIVKYLTGLLDYCEQRGNQSITSKVRLELELVRKDIPDPAHGVNLDGSSPVDGLTEGELELYQKLQTTTEEDVIRALLLEFRTNPQRIVNNLADRLGISLRVDTSQIPHHTDEELRSMLTAIYNALQQFIKENVPSLAESGDKPYFVLEGLKQIVLSEDEDDQVSV